MNRSEVPAAGLAVVRARLGLRFDATYQYAVECSVRRLRQMQSAGQTHSSRYLVLMVGHSGAGKSTIVDTNEPIRGMSCISTDLIHNELRGRFPRFQRDVPGTITYWELQWLTRHVRHRLIELIEAAGPSMVIDACNLSPSERASRLHGAKEKGYRTVIVYVETPEEVLLARLAARDEAYIQQGRNPAYVDMYRLAQKGMLVPPTDSEADVVIRVRGDGPIAEITLP